VGDLYRKGDAMVSKGEMRRNWTERVNMECKVEEEANIVM
jgi:hypothetical protein